jgi:hypothetical protein
MYVGLGGVLSDSLNANETIDMVLVEEEVVVVVQVLLLEQESMLSSKFGSSTREDPRNM